MGWAALWAAPLAVTTGARGAGSVLEGGPTSKMTVDRRGDFRGNPPRRGSGRRCATCSFSSVMLDRAETVQQSLSTRHGQGMLAGLGKPLLLHVAPKAAL